MEKNFYLQFCAQNEEFRNWLPMPFMQYNNVDSSVKAEESYPDIACQSSLFDDKTRNECKPTFVNEYCHSGYRSNLPTKTPENKFSNACFFANTLFINETESYEEFRIVEGKCCKSYLFRLKHSVFMQLVVNF